jgi:hypothetical protein
MTEYLVLMTITVPVKARDEESAIDKALKKMQNYGPYVTEVLIESNS